MNRTRSHAESTSRRPQQILLVLMAVLCSITAARCQNAASYQVGTILEVKEHQPTGNEDSTKRYDISVKVGNTAYLVLFTPQAGSNIAEYKTGLDFPVLVEGKTLKFADALGRPMTVPILSQKQLNKGSPQ